MDPCDSWKHQRKTCTYIKPSFNQTENPNGNRTAQQKLLSNQSHWKQGKEVDHLTPLTTTTRNWTQNLKYASQVLYHWAISPSSHTSLVRPLQNRPSFRFTKPLVACSACSYPNSIHREIEFICQTPETLNWKSHKPIAHLNELPKKT